MKKIEEILWVKVFINGRRTILEGRNFINLMQIIIVKKSIRSYEYEAYKN